MSDVRTPYDDLVNCYREEQDIRESIGVTHVSSALREAEGQQRGYLRALADTRAQREAADALVIRLRMAGTLLKEAGMADGISYEATISANEEAIAAYRKACEVQS